MMRRNCEARSRDVYDGMGMLACYKWNERERGLAHTYRLGRTSFKALDAVFLHANGLGWVMILVYGFFFGAGRMDNWLSAGLMGGLLSKWRFAPPRSAKSLRFGLSLGRVGSFNDQKIGSGSRLSQRVI